MFRETAIDTYFSHQYVQRNLCSSYCSQDRYLRLSIDTYFFHQHVQINRYNRLLAVQ